MQPYNDYKIHSTCNSREETALIDGFVPIKTPSNIHILHWLTDYNSLSKTCLTGNTVVFLWSTWTKKLICTQTISCANVKDQTQTMGKAHQCDPGLNPGFDMWHGLLSPRWAHWGGFSPGPLLSAHS